MSKLAKRRLGDWAVAIVAALVAIAIGWFIVEIRHLRDEAAADRERVDVLAQALNDEQSAAEARGEEPVAPDAEELIEDPKYSPQPIPDPPGPTDAQVYRAVEAYFDENPVQNGENASPTAIAAAVANYLTEHPPAQGDPGPPPSGDQVAAAVEAYLIEHPPPAGPPGADGEDATPEAIAAEVAAYLETHPLEYCPDGYSLVAHTVLTTEGPTDQIDCVADAPEEN